MAISPKSVKILWASAAGRCAFPECRQKLCVPEAGATAPYIIGEMAHIKGEKPGANRHDPAQGAAERDDYSNLILLCPSHHTLVDKPENEQLYDCGRLLTMKSEHETFVSGQLAQALVPLFQQNYQSFIHYGPNSEVARKNPESDAHGIWLSERLNTILPNNRRIQSAIEKHMGLFSGVEQIVLHKFRLHAQSYERWVLGDTSYEAVVRFPQDVEKLIQKLANACVQ